jgi:hypothetical protein
VAAMEQVTLEVQEVRLQLLKVAALTLEAAAETTLHFKLQYPADLEL